MFSRHLLFVPRRSRVVLMVRTVIVNSKTRRNPHNHPRLFVPLGPRRARATKHPIITKRLITVPSRAPRFSLPLLNHHTAKADTLRQRAKHRRGPSRTSVTKLPAALLLRRSGKQNSWMAQKSALSLPSINLGTTNFCALLQMRFALF